MLQLRFGWQNRAKNKVRNYSYIVCRHVTRENIRNEFLVHITCRLQIAVDQLIYMGNTKTLLNVIANWDYHINVSEVGYSRRK
jgi:hypothetical protein